MFMYKMPVLVVCVLAASGAFAAPVDKGEWTLSRTQDAAKVRLSLQSQGDSEHSFSSSSDWSLADLKDLDWTTTAKHDVRFAIVRDAGTIQGEGFVQDGAGAGIFTFQPNAQYRSEMAGLGFADVTDDDLFAYALHDVSLDFVRGIKAAGIEDLDKHKLIAFRIHGVTPEFVRAIHAAGVKELRAGELVAFRIHGVSPEFVKGLHDAGLDETDSGKLVAFRIHGVSPEWIGQLKTLGFEHPPSDKLIAARIHGVTPEYIEKMRAHGLQNLTLDELIRLRIHGVD